MLKKNLSKYFDTDATELLSKGISYLIIRVLGTLITFSFSVFVANRYGASIYGLISLGFTFFLIISVIGRLGLDINIVKFFSVNSENEDSGLFFLSILSVFTLTGLLSLLVYSQSEYIVNSVFEKPKPELVPYLNWVLPSIPFWSVTLLSANYLRSKKFNNWFVFFNSSSRFTFSLIFIFILSYFYSKNPIIVVKAHLYALIFIAFFSTAIAITKFKTIKIAPKKNIFKFIKESLPIMYSSSINISINWLGIFILGIYATSEEVGIFEVGLKISLLLTFISQALNSILAPKIAEKYHNNDLISFQKLISLSTNINFLTSLIITVFILIFNQKILSLFGSEFKDAFLLIVLLCLSQLVGSFCGSVSIILQMTGKQVVYQYLMIIAFVVILISMFILVPKYGGVGAAISVLLSMISWNVLGAIYIKKSMNTICFFKIQKI